MQEPCDIQRGVRGAKRGVPHARRRCTSERHVASKLVPIAAKVVVNTAQNDEMHSTSNGQNGTYQNGEKASDRGVGGSTESGVQLPRRESVCNGDNQNPCGDVHRVARSTTGIIDDGRSEVSRQPYDLEQNGSRECDSNSANATRTRSDIRECETVTRPGDIASVNSNECALGSPGSKKRQRSIADSDVLPMKRRSSGPASPMAL